MNNSRTSKIAVTFLVFYYCFFAFLTTLPIFHNVEADLRNSRKVLWNFSADKVLDNSSELSADHGHDDSICLVCDIISNIFNDDFSPDITVSLKLNSSHTFIYSEALYEDVEFSLPSLRAPPHI